MNPPVKRFLEEVFRAAVAAVEPSSLVREALRAAPEGVTLSAPGANSFFRWSSIGRIFIVGGGKAGRAMGEAAAGILGEKVAAGAIAVPSGKGMAAGPLRFIGAGHPYPDEGSREAAEEMLRLLSTAGEEDLVVALLSGGASAMISAPPEGVSQADKDAVIRLLLRSGADIFELNAVRKHLSRVKGGRMACIAHPARVWALLLSDVPGDDPSVIASGPFSPDPTTYGDAMKVLVRRRVRRQMPDSARVHIEAGVAGDVPETPKPGNPVFERVSKAVIGSNRVALDAAAGAAGKGGAHVVRILPGFLRGEARECAGSFVAELRRMKESVTPGGCAVLIAGGETTVTVRGKGKGGRNQEFALSAAAVMDGEEGMAVLCAGTDGIDGPTDATGAFADGSTCARAAALGLSPRDHIANNDAHRFFRALSDLVVTGPTGTNVADIAVGMILRDS